MTQKVHETKKTLYRPQFEHDACGIGAVVNIDGHPTHATVNDALRIVEKLEHRAGKDATGETGDGVGILSQIPHAFFSKDAAAHHLNLGEAGDYGVAMLFFHSLGLKAAQTRKLLETIVEKNDVQIIGWRKVPVCPEVLGKRARDCMPDIMQLFVRRPKNVERGIAFDRRLYMIRREFEQSCDDDTYVVSFSSRTIVYKGMFLVGQLRRFYSDLQSEDFQSAIAMVHSRFSTNTEPSWERAHPNRMILHNGEINTIRGNADRMMSREETMHSDVFGDDMEKVLPVVNVKGSDSAMLDNTLEFLYMNGMDLPQAVMVTIPEPWRNDKNMDRNKKDFYHYWATMMEPWDGPAAILFSDGVLFGAVLDRNGLRPSRYYVTKDGRVIFSSEVGVLDDLPTEQIIQKSRLQPGKMLLVDTQKQKLYSDEQIKSYYASRCPYGEWLDTNLIKLSDLPIPNKKVETYSQRMRDRLYRSFGYTYEEVKYTILPMAKNGIEPTSAMGTDIPLAALSDHHQPLFLYFKQLFAQVTNPPIDSLREEVVTDTGVYLGADGNLLCETGENCRMLEVNNPILTGTDMLKIRNLDRPGLKSETVSLLYYTNTSLEKALDRLFINCDRAYRNGATIIILSDRGVDENHVAIPSLLAVSAIEQHLIRTKKKTAVSILLESGEVRDVHQFATILGYGAKAIYPYLAHECIAELIDNKMLDKDYYTAVKDYNNAVCHGIVKIAAKMGISTIQSYQSAQIFECLGIRQDVVDRYFTNTVTRVGGIGLEEIAADVTWRHDHAFDPLGLGVDTELDSTGFFRERRGEEKEDHMYNPDTIIALQEATQRGDYNRFLEYTAMVDDITKPHTLRGTLEFAFDKATPVPLEEVEPEEKIVQRFKTGAMSYGSISQEAHECLAQAMNRLHGKSNSGEGGERPARLGTEMNSAIKQVASGRFGVTIEYLASAKEIQIKMAQGAKPGEGGHLPGKKVYPWIATTRYATPGVALISPPPHHDIYSIEDLAQLIYDLKNANRDARISVKLVSEAGVGTIAAGVAKAGAQVVLISGYDGGTGAAPQSSIHNAGLPWELGLAEAHQTLMQNGLRSRVALETDGKLMSGRDVAIAAILGAEEFGFATAPLVTMGCMMMRVCNLDTCPFGIATQNEKLRANFRGKPEYVMNFMLFIARELREIMAKLGVRSVEELVGRTDLIRFKKHQATKRAALIDMSAVIDSTYAGAEKSHFDPVDVYDFALEKTLDLGTLIPAFEKAIAKGKPYQMSVSVNSVNRTFGTMLGAQIVRQQGTNVPDDTYRVNCTGSCGQSFGAFLPHGLTLNLIGDSNDYFGKGLSGGKLVVRPPENSAFVPEENIIIGNVALYGATAGEAYINGIAGERFCVRNSGAVAVVEGCGDHGCEYMTGGMVLVLGKVGKNFAAGMSGGIAYVYDPDHTFFRHLNKEFVTMYTVEDADDVANVRQLLTRHIEHTHSPLATRLLASFDEDTTLFKKILPNDYHRMIQALRSFESQGMDHEEARMQAFLAVQK